MQNVFYRVALGMLHDDRVVLGVLLARIFTKMNSKLVERVQSVFMHECCLLERAFHTMYNVI